MECYSDEELLYLLHCGNETAEKYLYQRYDIYLKKWAARYLAHLDAVTSWEDLLQIGRMVLKKVFDTYRDDQRTSLKTYANIVYHRKMVSFIKASKRQRRNNEVESVSLHQPFDCDDHNLRYEEVIEDPQHLYHPKVYMSVKEEGQYYRTVFKEELSLRERIVMSYIQRGYSKEEVAVKLQIPLKSVYNAVYRYHQKMKDIDCRK